MGSGRAAFKSRTGKYSGLLFQKRQLVLLSARECCFLRLVSASFHA